MTMFTGRAAIEEFLETFDGWLSESVHVYLLGGTAMTIHGLKDRTEDVDLALGALGEFEHVVRSLREAGFVVAEEPTRTFGGTGRTVELWHEERRIQLDVFERQVVGKVWLTGHMRERAEEFWTGDRASASVLADEDMFLLKAVSAGDVGAGRRRDLEDMRQYAQRGLAFDRIVEEVERQRPFNTGGVEATQIRNRSHPLFAIEVAVDSLSGLPRDFTDRVATFGTEFAVEYNVLRAIEDGTDEVEQLCDLVPGRIASFEGDGTEIVDGAIDRLVEKEVLTRERGVVRLAV